MTFVFNNLPLEYQRILQVNVLYHKMKTISIYRNRPKYLRYFCLGYYGGPGAYVWGREVHTEICGARVYSIRCGTNMWNFNAWPDVSDSIQRRLPWCKSYDLIVCGSICHIKSPRPAFSLEQINTSCNIRIFATYLLRESKFLLF
jgi:hypothetical protein